MIHPAGIYFDLPEAEYRADESLSFSGCCDLLVSPLHYWARHIDPSREDESTAPMEYGRALHKLVLEGRPAFDQAYTVRPAREDYPDYLSGIQELRGRCRELGLKVGGSTEELCARIADVDRDPKLWTRFIEDWDAAHLEYTLLSREWADEMERTRALIEDDPVAHAAVSGGMPEVALFWMVEDVPMKARLDYLKSQAIVDLKTFTNPRGKSIDGAVAAAVANGRYHLQATIYSHGLESLKPLLRDNPQFVHGPVDQEWLAALVACPAHAFVFLFVEQARVPSMSIREFPLWNHGGVSALAWNAAWNTYKHALGVYADCKRRFGNEPWREPLALRTFHDEDFPLWMME